MTNPTSSRLAPKHNRIHSTYALGCTHSANRALGRGCSDVAPTSAMRQYGHHGRCPVTPLCDTPARARCGGRRVPAQVRSWSGPTFASCRLGLVHRAGLLFRRCCSLSLLRSRAVASRRSRWTRRLWRFEVGAFTLVVVTLVVVVVWWARRREPLARAGSVDSGAVARPGVLIEAGQRALRAGRSLQVAPSPSGAKRC